MTFEELLQSLRTPRNLHHVQTYTRSGLMLDMYSDEEWNYHLQAQVPNNFDILERKSIVSVFGKHNNQKILLTITADQFFQLRQALDSGCEFWF